MILTRDNNEFVNVAGLSQLPPEKKDSRLASLGRKRALTNYERINLVLTFAQKEFGIFAL